MYGTAGSTVSGKRIASRGDDADGYEDGVLETAEVRRRRVAVDVQHAERRAVDVDMEAVHGAAAPDRPDLGRSGGNDLVDPGHAHLLTVDVVVSVERDQAGMGAVGHRDDVGRGGNGQHGGQWRGRLQVRARPELDQVERVVAAPEPIGRALPPSSGW